MLLTGPIRVAPEFDPDAYLREKTAAPQAFDPDAYLREKRINDLSQNVTRPEAFGRGAAQGLTLGFGDEMAGGYAAAQKQIQRMPELLGVPDAELYASAMASPDDAIDERDKIRESNEAARKAHRGYFTGGEILGGAVPAAAVTMATGGAGTLPAAVAQGAASGAGYSNAATAGGVARDSAVGGLVGAAGEFAGQALGSGLRGVADLAKSKVATATGRAGTQATEEVSGALRALTSKYGAEVQKGSRQVENAMRLYEKMTPEQQTLYQQLEKQGIVPALQQQVAQSTLEAIPSQAATIAERKAAMQAAQSAMPQDIASRTQELLQPQIGKDVASFAKAYAEPVVASALAPAGSKHLAALIFARTRAGKALMSRVNRPGNQAAFWGGVQHLAEAPLSENPAWAGVRDTARDKAIDAIPDAADGLNAGNMLRSLIRAGLVRQSIDAAVGQ